LYHRSSWKLRSASKLSIMNYSKLDFASPVHLSSFLVTLLDLGLSSCCCSIVAPDPHLCFLSRFIYFSVLLFISGLRCFTMMLIMFGDSTMEQWFGLITLGFSILTLVVKYLHHLLRQRLRCLEGLLVLELILFFGLQLLFYRCILGS
jgi:hypothetical protein